MALYIADDNKCLFMFESGTYANTSGTSGCWIGLVSNHSPKDEETVIQLRYTGTASRGVGQMLNTIKNYGGTITYNPQDMRMLSFALGSVVDAGSPSPYTHVISEVNSNNVYPYTSGTGRNQNFASFTIVDSKKGVSDGEYQVRKYLGCVVDSLSMTIAQGEPVECELNYFAQSLTLGSKSTDSPNTLDEDTSRPYLWSDVKFHKPSGTVVDEVSEISFTINNNLDRRHYDNGSKVVNNLTPLARDYEVTLTMDANSSDAMGLYEDNWQSGTTFNSMLEMSISAGSEDAFIIMSGCKITSFESPSPNEGVNEYNITFVPANVIINSNDLIQKYTPW
jgi:hypothetical protein